jgi:hypothetical protein
MELRGDTYSCKLHADIRDQFNSARPYCWMVQSAASSMHTPISCLRSTLPLAKHGGDEAGGLLDDLGGMCLFS